MATKLCVFDNGANAQKSKKGNTYNRLTVHECFKRSDGSGNWYQSNTYFPANALNYSGISFGDIVEVTFEMNDKCQAVPTAVKLHTQGAPVKVFK